MYRPSRATRGGAAMGGGRGWSAVTKWMGLPVRVFALFAVAAGCADEIPTTDDPDRIPVNVETFEVRVPFSEFGSDVRSFSGFGSAASVSFPPVMQNWNGSLESRALFRFAAFPDSVMVRPEGETQLVADYDYALIGGSILITLDTLETLGSDVFRLEASQVMESWHARSATWEFAIDTLGGRVPWSEPGGGARIPFEARTWNPEDGDTVSFVVDSARASEWRDEGEPVSFLLDGTTENTRVRAVNAQLTARARSSINPDTVVVMFGPINQRTFIYDPGVNAVDSVMQIGGVPGNRVTFRVDLPERFDPGSNVCNAIECPIDPDDYQLLYGALVLTTHPPVSPSLTPRDTVDIQLREVLSPERLPRSPLGGFIHGPLQGIGPPAFSASRSYEIPLTAYLRSLVQPDSTDPDPTPTLAILGDPEPGDVYVSSFHSGGTEQEPWIRLIFSRSDRVPLP